MKLRIMAILLLAAASCQKTSTGLKQQNASTEANTESLTFFPLAQDPDFIQLKACSQDMANRVMGLSQSILRLLYWEYYFPGNTH